ncbi:MULTISPECIES: rhomboid-like protein [unclassified Streptomyces]|uniref:rhomboid-like protein n=1 Tax=unclassified Streptomyces TaxID=2593676 RepID=UPI0018FE128C|nr:MULTISPECIES: rhomboid-like protein [unclassified Streptomyces]
MNSPSASGPWGRSLRAVRAYPRRAPLTLAYVCLLLVGHVWIGQGLSADRAAGVLGHISTNLDNLQDHPLSALLGSVLFFDGTLTDIASTDFVGTFITLGLGVCCFLAWVERRWGKRRAVAVFLGGHVAATLLTAVVIIVALRQGWYPTAVRQSLDYGVSYGAQTVLAIGTLALPRRGRLPWAVFVLAWPLGGADWSAPLPDFTTIGHVVAALLGFGLSAVPAFRRQGVRATAPLSGAASGFGPDRSAVAEPTSPAAGAQTPPSV